MSSKFGSPAYLETGDSFCDQTMRSLLCEGRPPAAISPRALSVWISRRAWSDALDLYPASTTGAARVLVAAARHAGIARGLRRGGIDLLYVWRGLFGRAALGARAAQAEGIARVYFEGGPLPGWIQMDMQGVNARASIPRDPVFFRRWRQGWTRPLRDWRGLRATIRTGKPRRGLVGQRPRADWSGEEPFLFCPFQANEAGAVLPDAGWVSDPADLVAALAEASRALPDGWHLRLKPHPNARGDLSDLVARYPGARLVLDRDTDSLDQLRASRGVITVNSAMGLQAFYDDKPVIVLGDSYYSGLGRTETAGDVATLTRLVARPERLGFSAAARDELMSFLFNDFFVPQEELSSGAFQVASLLDRHRRHRALLAGGSA